MLDSYFIFQKKKKKKQTFLYNNEYKLTLQGNIIRGKLKAKDITKPILMTSVIIVGLKFVSIFPE